MQYMRSKNVIFLLTFFSVIELNAQHTWSLKECIDYALEHSQDMTMARLNIENRNLDCKGSISDLLPGLNNHILFEELNYEIDNDRMDQTGDKTYI